MRDTVAIVGSHPRTREEFDFSRDVDVWMFNEVLSARIPWAVRCDAVLQMHEEAIWRNPLNRNDPHHAEWLATQTSTRVYMQDHYEDVPMSERYPLEEIIERFKVQHFTSSVAYAIALAIHQGYKRIEVYGVEMETGTEYVYQRDGVTLWLGIAMGAGIEVDAHIGMFNQPLYGYQGEVVIPYETFDLRIAEFEPDIKRLNGEYLAANHNLKQAAKNLIAGDNSDRVFDTVAAIMEKGQEFGFAQGACQENQKYKRKADKMRETAGEFLLSRQEFESAAKTLTDAANKEKVKLITLGVTLNNLREAVMNAPKGTTKRTKLAEQYATTIKEYLDVSNQIALLNGAAQENIAYMQRLDKSIRAAGGSKSEAVLLESMRKVAA